MIIISLRPLIKKFANTNQITESTRVQCNADVNKISIIQIKSNNWNTKTMRTHRETGIFIQLSSKIATALLPQIDNISGLI